MSETIPESEFQEKLIMAIETEDLLGIHGLQQIIIRKYNRQLEINYGE